MTGALRRDRQTFDVHGPTLSFQNTPKVLKFSADLVILHTESVLTLKAFTDMEIDSKIICQTITMCVPIRSPDSRMKGDTSHISRVTGWYAWFITASNHSRAGLTDVLGPAHAAWHCARSKPGQARPPRYESSRTLVGERRRSSVFERKRTRSAVLETAKISENSEMSEMVRVDSTSRRVETWRHRLIVDEQRIRYGGSPAAISLWISLRFNCGQALLV